jgi:hypothetical protein
MVFSIKKTSLRLSNTGKSPKNKNQSMIKHHHQTKEASMGSIAFNLSERSRKELLERFAPKYAVVRCDHITVKFGVDKDVELPAAPTTVCVVGYACDDKGVECLVVEVDGSSVRADGLTFHITHSREEERRSVESNDVIKDCGWERFAETIPVEVTVAYNE